MPSDDLRMFATLVLERERQAGEERERKLRAFTTRAQLRMEERRAKADLFREKLLMSREKVELARIGKAEAREDRRTRIAEIESEGRLAQSLINAISNVEELNAQQNERGFRMKFAENEDLRQAERHGADMLMKQLQLETEALESGQQEANKEVEKAKQEIAKHAEYVLKSTESFGNYDAKTGVFTLDPVYRTLHDGFYKAEKPEGKAAFIGKDGKWYGVGTEQSARDFAETLVELTIQEQIALAKKDGKSFLDMSQAERMANIQQAGLNVMARVSAKAAVGMTTGGLRESLAKMYKEEDFTGILRHVRADRSGGMAVTAQASDREIRGELGIGMNGTALMNNWNNIAGVRSPLFIEAAVSFLRSDDARIKAEAMTSTVEMSRMAHSVKLGFAAEEGRLPTPIELRTPIAEAWNAAMADTSDMSHAAKLTKAFADVQKRKISGWADVVGTTGGSANAAPDGSVIPPPTPNPLVDPATANSVTERRNRLEQFGANFNIPMGGVVDTTSVAR